MYKKFWLNTLDLKTIPFVSQSLYNTVYIRFQPAKRGGSDGGGAGGGGQRQEEGPRQEKEDRQEEGQEEGDWAREAGHQIHNTENSKQIFLEKEVRGLSSNFLIHVSLSYSIPRIGLLILLQENMWTDPGDIWIAWMCGNWDWGHAIPFLGIHKWDFCCSVADMPAA